MPGNSGKPPGSRNRATVAAERLLEGEAEAITRKVVELALDGDQACLRLALERLVPVKRERSLEVDLPDLQSAADVPTAIVALMRLVGDGSLVPSEAAKLAGLVSGFLKAEELAVIEERVRALEERSIRQADVTGLDDADLVLRARAILQRYDGGNDE